MKKIKYLICFLLIIVGFLFNGELFIFYLDDFQESFYKASFALDDLPISASNDEIANDFISAGKAHNVDFFMVDSDIKSAYYKEITIYGTVDAIKTIEGKGIIEKEYTSLLMGKVKVRLESFKEIKDINTYEYCYYIGDKDEKEKLDAFKVDLVDKYGGGFPKLYGSDKETKLNILTVWLTIISIILILTIYDVVFQKKEVAVRIILGEESRMILLRNLLYDTGFLLITFIAIPLIFKEVTNVYFYISYIAVLFAILIVLNTLINATLLFVNFKKNFASNTSGHFLLFVNYSQKTIVSVLVVLILASNSIAISKGIDYYKQGSFFEENKEYSYYQLNYRINNKDKTREDEDLMNQHFYKQFQNRSLLYCDLSRNFYANYPIIMVNRNAMNRLVEDWLFLAEMKADFDKEGYYILAPDTVRLDSKEFESAENNFDFLFSNNGSIDAKVIQYQENFEVVGIANNEYFQSSMMTNPIVIYDNTTPNIDPDAASDFMPVEQSIMYDITEEDFQDFVEEYGLNHQIVVKSNVLDVYSYNWSILSRTMKIVSLLSVFLIILEMLLVIFIIQMEYKFNAVEMALKKILGYSIFERNTRLVKVTTISAIISFIAVWVLLALLELPGSFSVLWGVPFILILELLFISHKARSIEIRSIPAVLKGERI